jgi:hypothetical protein
MVSIAFWGSGTAGVHHMLCTGQIMWGWGEGGAPGVGQVCASWHCGFQQGGRGRGVYVDEGDYGEVIVSAGNS